MSNRWPIKISWTSLKNSQKIFFRKGRNFTDYKSSSLTFEENFKSKNKKKGLSFNFLSSKQTRVFENGNLQNSSEHWNYLFFAWTNSIRIFQASEGKKHLFCYLEHISYCSRNRRLLLHASSPWKKTLIIQPLQ